MKTSKNSVKTSKRLLPPGEGREREEEEEEEEVVVVHTH